MIGELIKAIGSISGILTLIAFLATCIVVILSIQINKKKNLILTAKEDKRSELVNKTLEFFNVDVDKLTNKQKYEIVLKQIDERSKRHLRLIVLTLSLSIIFSITFIISIINSDIPPIEKSPISKNKISINELQYSEGKGDDLIKCESIMTDEKDIQGISYLFGIKFVLEYPTPNNENYKKSINYKLDGNYKFIEGNIVFFEDLFNHLFDFKIEANGEEILRKTLFRGGKKIEFKRQLNGVKNLTVTFDYNSYQDNDINISVGLADTYLIKE